MGITPPPTELICCLQRELYQELVSKGLGISSAEETEAQKSGRLWLPLFIQNQSAYLGAILNGVHSLSQLTSLLGTVGTMPRAHNILGHTEMFNFF